MKLLDIVEAFNCAWTVKGISPNGYLILRIEKYLEDTIKMNVGDVCKLEGKTYTLTAVRANQSVLLAPGDVSSKLSRKEMDDLPF